MIRKGQARWVSDADVRKQNQFIDQLFDLAARNLAAQFRSGRPPSQPSKLQHFHVDYYHRTRTHLSLGKDCPHSRPIQPPRVGRVVAIPKVGGLHHRYERLAA